MSEKATIGEGGMDRSAVDLDSIMQRAREIGDGVETTELSGGLVSIDFGLFAPHRFEKALERGGGGSLGDAVERGALPESVADFGQRKLDAAGSDMDARTAGNDLDVETQRTGGLCKSSLILTHNGIITEYNLRLPPIDAAECPKTTIESRLVSICRNARKEALNGGSIEEDIFARPRFPDEIEDDMKEYIRSQGYLGGSVPEREWYPHIRSSESSVPVSAFLDFTESALARFDRRFPQSRRWATPEAGRAETDTDPLDELRESVTEFQVDDSGASIAFQLPGADEQSQIQISDRKVCSYELALPPHDPDEFGKILLRKAIEHAVETRGVLLNGDHSLDASGDVYRPYIENPSCSEPLDTVAADVTTLTDAYDMIRERSRLS
ncbi:hypothetical protein [Halococcus agarilyticus]|uniref:hypothetical protein n=1 Tax=Halococcus agarilyticus TaxID=1232219 RepID=UPI0006777D6A|nr:hypothetical protein [Halococcus agarilyticus]